MYVQPQLPLPGAGTTALQATVTILATPEGPASVHWRISTVPGGETIALGATIRKSSEDAATVSGDVLADCWGVLETLTDPFATSEVAGGSDGTSETQE